MDQWMDSLSEEWVSQPRTSSPNITKPNSPAMRNTSQASIGSQSRIPLIKSRSTSSNVVGTSRQSTGPRARVHGEDSALVEKTASNINATSTTRPVGTASTNGTSPRPPHAKAGKRHVSTTSLPATQRGTILYNMPRTSPADNNGTRATPEWKKRVLQGKANPQNQRDLFSPIGLENIFKAPTIGSRSKQQQKKKGRMFEAVSMDDFPSSPPLNALKAANEPQVTGRDATTIGRQTILGVTIGGQKSSEPEQQWTSTFDRNRTVSMEDDLPHETISPISFPGLQTERPSSRSSDNAIDYRIPSILQRKLTSTADASELTSLSLPDDLSMGTETYASNGGFISIRRGGYSTDGSFQRKPLSPSSLQRSGSVNLASPDTLERKVLDPPATSPGQLQHSNRSISTSPSPSPIKRPRTPPRQKSKDGSESERPRSSGSPLKLFDKYDTFTNDRLLRRMSQFEGSFHDERDEVDVDGEEFDGSKYRHHARSAQKSNRRSSGFGSGDLESYSFTHRVVSGLGYAGENEEDSDNGDSITLPTLKHSQSQFPSRSIASTRQVSNNSASSLGKCRKKRHPQVKAEHAEEDGNQHQTSIQQVDLYSTEAGKRLPNSPVKDPSPKRRGAIHSKESSRPLIPDIRVVDGKNPIMQSIAGRKRKDARYDGGDQMADPKTIAQRQILHPRTATTSRVRADRSSLETFKAGLDVKGRSEGQEADRDLDEPTKVLADELAGFALDVAQDVTSGNRKASVTTADFFNEAQMIMQQIRAKGRPQSARSSVEDPGLDYLDDIEESTHEGSTKDEFSRPPSREGVSLRKIRQQKQLDPRVVSHLRKFEDGDDLGIALSSSEQSIHLGPEHDSIQVQNAKGDSPANRAIESDPPNVRILAMVGQAQSSKIPGPASYSAQSIVSEGVYESRSSQASSGPPTEGSNPTGSSTASRAKAIIAPDKVSHLISDHMAGMTFDRARQTWAKKRDGMPVEQGCHGRSFSNVSEPDPFDEIPDLSVDELEEVQRLKKAVASAELISGESNGIETTDQFQEQPKASCVPIHENKNSNVTIQTREIIIQSRTNRDVEQTVGYKDSGNYEEEVEHEISILEGRESRTPKRSSRVGRQPRVVTVAFSSPLVNQMLDADVRNARNEEWDVESDLDLASSPEARCSGRKSTMTRKTSQGRTTRSQCRQDPRRFSFGPRTYVAHPISRIDEQDELSFLQEISQNRNMSIVVSTPQPNRGAPGTLSVPPTTGKRSNIEFYLSPLPDFTVHQLDECHDLDRSHLAKRRNLLSAQDVEGRYSLAIKELVGKITDIEPFEPYWDFIRRLDLAGHGLLTLHMLDEFCGRIEDLDVSDNELGQLHGAPISVRFLNVKNNCLSNLTAWGHLRNLQHLDISGNELENLDGLQSLVHLREVRADNNQIESLNGIMGLDGLVRLRLRRNRVKEVVLDECNLQRLTHLDLRDNQATRISSLHLLPKLKHLNLRGNNLISFSSDQPVHSLVKLDLSRNNISSVDMTKFPSLGVLNIDHTPMCSINMTQTIATLQTLSWRDQRASEPSERTDSTLQRIVSTLTDINALALSGTQLLTVPLHPFGRFLNLQVLELAFTGLTSLPSMFGSNVPNLRVLNLNHNAIKDIRPLLGIERMTELYLVGNRISRLRRTAAVLGKLGAWLKRVDLRGNAIVGRFYCSSSASARDTNGSGDVAKNEQRELVLLSRWGSSSNHTPTSFSFWMNTTEEEREEEDPIAAAAKNYLLPPASEEADEHYKARLDPDTALRRRVYELLLLTGCKALIDLDGLSVENSREKIYGQRDTVWKRLVDLGVLRMKMKRKRKMEMEMGVHKGCGGEEEEREEEGEEEQRSICQGAFVDGRQKWNEVMAAQV